ncbi:hypothetical protein M8J73_09795 [Streptomyces neyagawaensis]|nr:hypothetical protein [Streptomyces neyagawaensis]
MAMANKAWILAADGKRVLAVDLDLKAPGLHRFFEPFLDPDAAAATSGIIGIITEYSWAATTSEPRSVPWHLDYARVEEHDTSLDPNGSGLSFPDGGTLDFLAAGRLNREYSATVSSFEWDNFYERLGDDDAWGLDEETYCRRRDVLGPDHPYTLPSAARLGRDLREVAGTRTR